MGKAMPTEAVAPDRVLVPTELYQSAIRPMGGHYGASPGPSRGAWWPSSSGDLAERDKVLCHASILALRVLAGNQSAKDLASM